MKSQLAMGNLIFRVSAHRAVSTEKEVLELIENSLITDISLVWPTFGPSSPFFRSTAQNPNEIVQNNEKLSVKCPDKQKYFHTEIKQLKFPSVSC